MVAIRLLKPEEAARRAKANVAAFKTEQVRKAAEAKLAERRAEEADTTPLPPKKSPSNNKEEKPAVSRKKQEELDKELLDYTRAGLASRVELALDAGADVNARDKSHGRTALMKAARRLDEDTMTVLIDAGADPNIQRPDGNTALMAAVEEGGFMHVEMLLRAGADPNLRNSEGQTALMIGVKEGGEEYFHELVGHTIMLREDREKRDYEKTAAALVAAGADVNSADNEGVTPLMRAAYHGMDEVVELLANNKADVNAKDSNGKCVLKYAREGWDNAFMNAESGTNTHVTLIYESIVSFLKSQGATE